MWLSFRVWVTQVGEESAHRSDENFVTIRLHLIFFCCAKLSSVYGFKLNIFCFVLGIIDLKFARNECKKGHVAEQVFSFVVTLGNITVMRL